MTDGAVAIRRSVIDQILRQADAEAPLECCGLLLGTDSAHVEDAYPARNALGSPTRFAVEPEDHFAAIRQARARALAVVGAYHSHPATPAVPSARDLDEASYPDFVYVIVGLPAHEVRAFRLVEGNFRPAPLVPFC